MSLIPNNYIEKLYAGWLGKLIGIRFGAPIEGWSYEKILKTLGELDGYIVDYKEFAADDDSNGPMFFLRALEDYTYTSELTAEQIGLTWLNYAPYEHGFYWWGGYGVSTEHTAYLNLRNGIPAPRSGSIEQNGSAVAEQIGGQIFIDTWGLTIPGNPALAAEYAQKAASVSHDGNGIYGGIFVAACVSQAFIENDIEKIIQVGLEYIPADSEYTRMAHDVIKYYNEDKDNWHSAFKKVQENYGYHLYPGNCHIVPNSAVIILSLLYGQGDFTRSIQICNMCGWDTDCNVANVGAIVGTMVGLDGIDYEKWIKPINDFIACSSVVGDLNIMDIPWAVRYMAYYAYKIADQEIPEKYKKFIHLDPNKFDFELPGSTHGFKIKGALECSLKNTGNNSEFGDRCLRISGTRMDIGDKVFVFRKTHYKPSDFHDSRYDPCFSPTVYPGETLSCKVKVDEEYVGKVKAALYATDEHTGDQYIMDSVMLNNTDWHDISFDIPCGDACISETGVMFEAFGKEGWETSVVAYIDDFEVSGCADYVVDFSKERNEYWTNIHSEVSQFTYLKGMWNIEDNLLVGRCADFGETYTGRHNFKNYSVEAVIIPRVGNCHQLNFRVEGAIRSYALALRDNNKIILRKNCNGYIDLASKDFEWRHNQKYTLKVDIVDNKILAYIDGINILEFIDTDNPYMKGQIGFSVLNGSCCAFEQLRVNCI